MKMLALNFYSIVPGRRPPGIDLDQPANGFFGAVFQEAIGLSCDQIHRKINGMFNHFLLACRMPLIDDEASARPCSA